MIAKDVSGQAPSDNNNIPTTGNDPKNVWRSIGFKITQCDLQHSIDTAAKALYEATMLKAPTRGALLKYAPNYFLGLYMNAKQEKARREVKAGQAAVELARVEAEKKAYEIPKGSYYSDEKADDASRVFWSAFDIITSAIRTDPDVLRSYYLKNI
jgi:hypothetical protein